MPTVRRSVPASSTAVAVRVQRPQLPTPSRTPADFFPSVTLRQGVCGPAVKLWQRWIQMFARARSTPAVTPDGVFGSSTRKATVAVQRLVGAKADGVVGPDTQRRALSFALAVGLNAPPSDPSASAARCPSSAPGQTDTAPVDVEDDPVPDSGGGFGGAIDFLIDNGPIVAIGLGAAAFALMTDRKR